MYEIDKLEAFVGVNVYVLPSVYEIFTVAVLEVCAGGVPVIVIDICNIADLVSSRVVFMVKCDKYNLQDTIVKVLCDENLRKNFLLMARNVVREKFNWINMVG